MDLTDSKSSPSENSVRDTHNTGRLGPPLLGTRIITLVLVTGGNMEGVAMTPNLTKVGLVDGRLTPSSCLGWLGGAGSMVVVQIARG